MTKIILMAGSTRHESINKRLIHLSNKFLQSSKQDSAIINMEDYRVPVYCGDLEEKNGIPENAKKLAQTFEQTNKIIFSIPEYNYSVPGAFKNLVDWVSRLRPIPFQKKKILLMTASPSGFGGNRSYWHASNIFNGLGSIIYPGTFSLSNGFRAFEEKNLKDDTQTKNLEKLLKNFIEF